MKLGILSDSHDHIEHLDRMLAMLREEGAEALLFCGDLCAPFILPQLAEGLDGPIHIVLGNNDGDPLLIGHQAGNYDAVTVHGPFADLEIDGRRIALVHYPELGRPLAASGWYDLVCFGHNHTAELDRDEETVLLNPGEVMGRFGRVTAAIYDTVSAEAAHLEASS